MCVHRAVLLLKRSLRAEFAVFGSVGAACLVGDIVFFNLFAFQVGMTPLVAKSVSMVITGAMAFFGHRHLTFRDRAGGGYRREVPLFVLVTLATVVLSLLPLYAARHLAGLDSVLWLNIANLVGIALGTVARYGAYRGLVWSRTESAPRSEGDTAVAVPSLVSASGSVDLDHSLAG
jgi:putative flippase GtrA